MKRNFLFMGIVSVIALMTSCQKKSSLFENLSSAQTNITFQNTLGDRHLFNILYYLYYYNGGGVAVGDINNDGLPDIYFTANSKGNNKLYLNKGKFVFEDITEKAGVAGFSDWASGVTMADVNADGYLDIYVSTVSQAYGLKGHNELYINNHDNTFSEKSAEYGLNTSCFTTQAAFFDYDNDGDLDCYILNQSHQPHANITDTSRRRTYDSLTGDRLMRNDVSTLGRFTDVSAAAGIYQSTLGYGLGVAIGDVNNDGWNDIYVGNDFHENDYYYINNGNGTFTESGAAHFGHYSRFSMGNDIADYDNDGQLDLVTVDMLPPDEKTLKTYGSDENPDIYALKLTHNGYQDQYSRNCLQRNNGNGSTFSDEALISGVAATDWSWSPLFADFDNDGRKDLFISSGIVKRPVDLDYVRFVSGLKAKGMDRTDAYDDEAINAMPDGASHPFLFRGNRGNGFTDVSDEWGTARLKGYFNGSAYADLDNDGKLDMVINCLNAPAVILKNKAAGKNYLDIRPKGDSLNHFGIGAKVYLFDKGEIQYQQLMLTRGFQSSMEPKIHFGINDQQAIDSVLIVWPNSKYQLFTSVKANQTIEPNIANAADSFRYQAFFPPVQPLATDITFKTNLSWTHQENSFLDYNMQYLIPHKESTRGPRMAVADINNDGLEDFYLCGAKGQPGSLFIQLGDGKFAIQDSAVFNRFAICEDVDAIFFDADGDKDPDLWVVSGGNEMPENEIASADRLFINEGGHFVWSPRSIPALHENKSCITVADVDKDGDNDVFVGFLSDPMKYGMPQNSYLYLNDGHGKFAVAPTKMMNLLNIGMVTSARFADFNRDGWPDLVVTGEWMPMKIFMNNKGSFTATDLPVSAGLWQSLLVTDVNGDGYDDILAGNWGENCKLWAGKDGPLKLYVNDFDHNGSIEQILCYTESGKEYTFLAKDELERALPVLKKAYLKYSDVAGKTVQYMFYDLFKDYVELKADVLASSCFFNDGKGNFTRIDLPREVQLAPVFAFAPFKNGFVAAGNFFGVVPYEGKYDALMPTYISFNKQNGTFTSGKQLTMQGETRDMKWIIYKKEKVLAIARNNQSLMFYQPIN